MEIPVTFELEGKEYKGILSKVAGSGSNATYHLMVDRYYWGQLSYIAAHEGLGYCLPRVAGWRFSSNTKQMDQLSEHLGNIVELWNDSHYL